jgi:hypothetical protein
MTTYVIEARNNDGTLKFDCPQPESYFGNRAITGITEDEIAKAIFRTAPDATMSGMNISAWPRNIDQNWTARIKTW